MDLYLRSVIIEDAEDILRWRNDPSTRESSFTKDEIELEAHYAWLKKKLCDRDCFMYILMDGEKKVGNIRVDIEDGIGEISYMIAPESRGKGYGKKILELVEPEVSKKVISLVGYTLKSNTASGRCFTANGYTCKDEGDSYCYTKRF